MRESALQKLWPSCKLCYCLLFILLVIRFELYELYSSCFNGCKYVGSSTAMFPLVRWSSHVTIHIEHRRVQTRPRRRATRPSGTPAPRRRGGAAWGSCVLLHDAGRHSALQARAARSLSASSRCPRLDKRLGKNAFGPTVL